MTARLVIDGTDRPLIYTSPVSGDAHREIFKYSQGQLWERLAEGNDIFGSKYGTSIVNRPAYTLRLAAAYWNAMNHSRTHRVRAIRRSRQMQMILGRVESNDRVVIYPAGSGEWAACRALERYGYLVCQGECFTYNRTWWRRPY